MSTAACVLLVEDEENLASLVEAYLAREGYRVASVGSAAAALETLEQEAVRLVVLDLTLPDMDGLELCRQIRTRSSVPIVMLTARDEARDRIAGFDVGADDYIGKPFSPGELVARMKAVLRRVEPETDEDMLVLGDVIVRRGGREVEVGGDPVGLRPKEFDLLAFMIQNRGVVMSRDVMLERVWGYGYTGGTRTVDVHVAQLRRKLRRPELIQTIRGLGYKAVQPSNPSR
jgi:DNA-binding response OmpR family regulator